MVTSKTVLGEMMVTMEINGAGGDYGAGGDGGAWWR
jgi:hypothetical protein